ncbi:MAG: HAD family hydrolase [Candidatus Marinimicrobia bacterium]|nr:HAD family hydrolase [Candidatus Neomarinimicrobiota bacterium]
MTPAQPIAAFFDFDETLLSIDSAGIGFKVLREQGYLSWGFMLKMTIVLFLRKMGLVDEKVMAAAMVSFYKGRDLKLFEDNALDFYTEYLRPNLSSEVLAKLRWHQEQGHHTVLLTGSIEYYLKPVVEDLGIDHLLCSHLEVDEQGLLTGRPLGPICVKETKLILAKELAENNGIDLSKSYAYGNSESDIPMLGGVGYPFIVNPTPGLLKHAHRQGWPVL